MNLSSLLEFGNLLEQLRNQRNTELHLSLLQKMLPRDKSEEPKEEMAEARRVWVRSTGLSAPVHVLSLELCKPMG